MKESFLEYSLRESLACPICRGSLEIRKATRRNSVIQRAILSCVSCSTLFKVYARIPVLLKPGQYACWNHPHVEAVFGFTLESYEELLRKYGVEEVRRRAFRILRGEYSPPKVFFKEPVDRRLLAIGGWRIRKCYVERHLRRIKEQTKSSTSLRRMVGIAREYSPCKILDMCSGGGFFLTCLIEKYRDFKEFYSFDIDYKCAKRVEGTLTYYKLLDRSLPMVADARAMPFKENYFDIITNNCGFNQILGYTKAVKEAYRVLKPGGKLIVREFYGITTWDSGLTRRNLGFTVDELVELYRHYDIYVNKESFIKILEKTGFTIELVEDINDKYYLLVCTK